MKKRINISIDSDIHEQAQKHAFRKGISLSNFIETELCRAMKQHTELSSLDYPSIWSQLNSEQRSHLVEYMVFLTDRGRYKDLTFESEGVEIM